MEGSRKSISSFGFGKGKEIATPSLRRTQSVHEGDEQPLSLNESQMHEYLQHQSYMQDMYPHYNPNPPLIISEPTYNPNSNPMNPHVSFSLPSESESQNTPDLEIDAAPTSSVDGKKLKSDLFAIHMKKIIKDDGTKVVRCNYCSKEYVWATNSGYGTYRKHINTQHPVEAQRSKGQTQISRYATPNSQLFKYNDATNKEEIAKFVAVEGLSYSFGQKVGFINYIQRALNPAAGRIDRSTVKNQIFEIYIKWKKELIKCFKNYKGCISICADIWSDHWQTHSYLGVTCHYIDSGWLMQKRIIALRGFDESHTADAIYRMLRTIFEEYHIEKKIFAIGFDNASTNTAAIPHLQTLCNPTFGGRFFHQRCACHVINLCVQTGLQALKDYIRPIRDALFYLWKHPSVMKAWANFCKQNGKRPRRFPRDVPTRWNSTYKLLNSSYEYRDLLVTFMQYHVSHIVLHAQHWDVCQQICELLAVFYNASNTLSGIYYPTTNLFMVEAVNIVGALQTCLQNELLQHCATVMKAKWLDYYRNIPIIYLIALCFDPRCKIDMMYEYICLYYSCLELNDIDVQNIYNNIKYLFNELYNEYVTLYGSTSRYSQSRTTVSTSGSSTSSSSKIFGVLGHQLLSKYSKKFKSSHSENNIREIDIYLNTSFEFIEGTNFKILEWWRDHEKNFPILSIVAKQVLGTPVSTVAVEQEFSSSGNTLDARRSRMDPASLEIQVCVRDWEKAKNRVQEDDESSPVDDCFDNDNSQAATDDTSDE